MISKLRILSAKRNLSERHVLVHLMYIINCNMEHKIRQGQTDCCAVVTALYHTVAVLLSLPRAIFSQSPWNVTRRWCDSVYC